MLNGPTDISFHGQFSKLESDLSTRESREQRAELSGARGQAAEACAPLSALPHRPSERDAHARAVHEKWRDYK